MLSKCPQICKYLFLLTITVAILAPFGFLYAEDAPSAPGYVQLAPLPTPPSGVVTQTGLAGYLQTLFWLAIVLAGVLAVLMITKGGILYMTSEAFNTKAAAKTQITMAIVGFLLAVSSVLILTTINPDLLKFNLLVRQLTFTVPPLASSGSITGCTNFVTPPVTGCAWVSTRNSSPQTCEEALKGTAGEYNWFSGLDSYCSAVKTDSFSKCCQYIPPTNGCSGRGIKDGYTRCQWSQTATIGNDCPADFTQVNILVEFADYRCDGTPPIKASLLSLQTTSSDCCIRR